MRTLVLCDDAAHPASLTRDGLGGLGECGYEFVWQEDPSEWSAEEMNGYPLVIVSKANNRSQTDSTPWATEAIGRAFVNYVAQGNSILFLHSGTAGYENAPSLCQLMGGIFTGHPAQCPVTVEPRAGHPLTVGSAAFTGKDEHYQMAMNDPNVDHFLNTTSEHGTQPGGWTRSEGKGRVCVFTPTHTVWYYLVEMDTPKSLFMLLSGGVLMAHKGYDRDFKLEAIRLASESGIKVSAVARRLGISNGIISRWKRQLREDEEDAFPGTGHVRPSEIEVRELRRENDRLRRERDILKKARVIFSEKG
jgi:transposase-like protein